MFQVVMEHQEPSNDSGPFRVEVHFAGEIKVSPTLARRRVNGYLAMRVMMAVLGGEPVLILGQRPVWRVPARFSPPGMKNAAPTIIGSIDVDANSGEVIPLTDAQIEAMRLLANAIVASSSLPATQAG